jgi:DNA-binding beta-propeller fold protein YncE
MAATEAAMPERRRPSPARTHVLALAVALTSLVGWSSPALTPILLPGANGVLDLDYLACDRATGRVWVPAAGTGSVDVIEPHTFAVKRVEGFPTAKRTLGGREFVLGPTAIALGDGVAYVGNRGDSRICAVDAKRLRVGRCLALGSGPDDLASSPDGLAYVAAVKELWVTQGAPPLGILPPDRSIVVLDASKRDRLAPKTKIALEGAAEGYAVDERHGVFYTNLADQDRTLAIDVRAHRVRAKWQPKCGGDGPRGIAVDEVRGFVFVACTDRVVVLDANHDGAPLASRAAGAGIDNIDYVEGRRELFVAAGKDGMLTVLRVGDGGTLDVGAITHTTTGARVVVADAEGTAYLIDPRGGRILALPGAR